MKPRRKSKKTKYAQTRFWNRGEEGIDEPPLDERNVVSDGWEGESSVAATSVEAERDRREGKNKGKDKGGREEARQNFERIEPATDYSYGNS